SLTSRLHGGTKLREVGEPQKSRTPDWRFPVRKITLLIVLFLCAAVVSAKEAPQTFTVKNPVFITGNNKAANDIRKQLSKDSQKGKSCLVPTDDPAKADLHMDVNQGAPGSGFSGSLSAVSVSVTNN